MRFDRKMLDAWTKHVTDEEDLMGMERKRTLGNIISRPYNEKKVVGEFYTHSTS